jgi:hypothetical protein
VQVEGIGGLKKSNDLIGIRTRDLPACSILPQPTTLLHAPTVSIYREIFKAIAAFTAPRFSATGMLSAARCMRVLSITQHA